MSKGLFHTYRKKIFCYITGICLFSFLSGGLLIKGITLTLGVGSLAIVLLLSMLLMQLINRSNRQIRLFFDSLSHHDFTTRFSTSIEEEQFTELYDEMNRITKMFSENQTQLQEKQHYYEGILKVMTHEIRNSITPITSLTADLITHFNESTPGEIKEGLEIIRQQGNTLISFLDSYHRLTHLPEPSCEPVDLNVFFEKLKRLLKAEEGSDKLLYDTIPHEHWRMDTNLVILALLNLIRNGLYAIREQEDGWVKINAKTINGHHEIKIIDNGPGISPPLLSAIFIPFYSTKKEGSGIGLSIAYRIMQLHGGQLTVDSVPGVHTIFTLRF